MEKANTLKKWLVRCKNKPEKLVKYAKYLSDFAQKSLQKSNAQGYVLGISGGIDSALALAILSSNSQLKVLGVFIDIESQPMDKQDAQSLKQVYNFEYKEIDLTAEYRMLVEKMGIGDNELAKVNLKVRLRAITLYALAQKYNLLTCGTTNADEKLVGYYTKFGDNACDISLLCYLNKAQIRYLACQYKVPADIIARKPSAGLYEDQSDEKELGLTYEEIDHYLSFAVIDPAKDALITTKYVANKHKLNAPIKPKKFMKLRNVD